LEAAPYQLRAVFILPSMISCIKKKGEQCYDPLFAFNVLIRI